MRSFWTVLQHPFFQAVHIVDVGLVVGGIRMLEQYKWVKFVRKIPTGWVFTCETAVVFTDDNWNVVEDVVLPRPFQVHCLEMS